MSDDRYMSRSSDQQQDSQNFYPSYAIFQNPPMGHSKPYHLLQETAYSHRPTGFQQQQFLYEQSPRISGYKNRLSEKNNQNQEILGSGNFGIIKGGTFFSENDRDLSEYNDRYNPYYQNGHGRPLYFPENPRPTKHEQFANFRDFADINAPPISSYSQVVVIYANKNETVKVPKNKPKNINEQLVMLENESHKSADLKSTKLSKIKDKFSRYLKKGAHQPKKNPVAKRNELNEPLLALS